MTPRGGGGDRVEGLPLRKISIFKLSPIPPKNKCPTIPPDAHSGLPHPLAMVKLPLPKSSPLKTALTGQEDFFILASQIFFMKHPVTYEVVETKILLILSVFFMLLSLLLIANYLYRFSDYESFLGVWDIVGLIVGSFVFPTFLFLLCDLIKEGDAFWSYIQ